MDFKFYYYLPLYEAYSVKLWLKGHFHNIACNQAQEAQMCCLCSRTTSAHTFDEEKLN